MYKKIVNPITGKLVNTNGKLGRQILNNYLIQLGGHSGPCGLNSKTGRCKKSSSWDNANCELVNGRCKNKKKSSTTSQKPPIRETISTSSKQEIKSRIEDRKKKSESRKDSSTKNN